MTAQLRRAARSLAFAGYFVRLLVVANWEVVSDLLTPGSRLRPGIVALPLRSRSAGEITLLSALITLTPGTLTIDVSDDLDVMYVHGMYAPDADEFRAELSDLESRMLHAVRLDDHQEAGR
ncbi:Na+/H+ antiporter subunit E [Aquipuribacter sp. MA13-6]|uniref:Na+/H+ antiporter subunit E n=1 Tax=unclassified Aquipuribacter TaxID=2635084 RepID=UPI003EEAF9F6